MNSQKGGGEMKNKTKYEIHIKKYENGKEVAGLIKEASSLDELIKNIVKLVERLRQ